MKTRNMMGLVAVLAGLTVPLWMGTGCEEADGVAGLTVTADPPTVDATNSASVLTVQISGASNSLALPLEWRVTNPAMGSIQGNSGYTAIYLAYPGAKGVNVVTARDQYDNEGSVAITHQ